MGRYRHVEGGICWLELALDRAWASFLVNIMWCCSYRLRRANFEVKIPYKTSPLTYRPTRTLCLECGAA